MKFSFQLDSKLLVIVGSYPETPDAIRAEKRSFDKGDHFSPARLHAVQQKLLIEAAIYVTLHSNWEGRAMSRKTTIVVVAAVTALLSAVAASATETITYTYDARGRLVQVNHSGSVNNGVQTTYTQDKVDNRTNVTTTGA